MSIKCRSSGLQAQDLSILGHMSDLLRIIYAVMAHAIHYQFETIHPFLDGNGRVGRLMILLYLMEQGYISKPIIYISYFLKKNQIEYYDRISEVSRSGNYEQWVGFFLEAVSAAAKASLATVEKLSALHAGNIERLPVTARKNDNVRRVFDYIEQYPIINIKRTAADSQPTYEEVCDNSGHAETVRIDFDEDAISLTRLLQYYFQVINPTSINRQGNDVGIQYRTGIYYTEEEQLAEVNAEYKRQEKIAGAKLAVEVQPVKNFFPTEEYHQKYLDKNPGGYCHIPPRYFALQGKGNHEKAAEKQKA